MYLQIYFFAIFVVFAGLLVDFELEGLELPAPASLFI